ncbi:MAG: hypothetical protein GY906_28555 [bacterium]|nr:hypothetical protein [bacterium]
MSGESGYNISWFIVGAITLLIVVFLGSGCASGSHAAEGAKRGATTGAVSGAVGGLMSALIFGGDPVERAAHGAVWGGTTGAVAGGMSGHYADKAQSQAQQKQQTDDLALLRKDIGDDAFDALSALAECDHPSVMRHAADAKRSDNPNYALAGRWLEVLSYADQQDEASARALFPELIEADWNISTAAEAEAEMRKGVSDLMNIREEYGQPRVCSK